MQTHAAQSLWTKESGALVPLLTIYKIFLQKMFSGAVKEEKITFTTTIEFHVCQKFWEGNYLECEKVADVSFLDQITRSQLQSWVSFPQLNTPVAGVSHFPFFFFWQKRKTTNSFSSQGSWAVLMIR